MSAASRFRLDLLLLAFLAAATNLAYFHYSNRDFFFPDSFTYMAPATSLVEGKGFTTEGSAETLRTPGYPLLLAAMHLVAPGMRNVVLLQHALNVGLVIAVYLFARRRFGTAAARIAALVLAVDPVTIHYANKVLTENVFTVLLFLIVLACFRLADGGPLWLAVLSGGAAGFLALVRPVAIVYFVVAAIFLYGASKGRRTLITAAFLIPAVAIAAGWALRNYRATGVFTVSSLAGTNMLFHRAAGALAVLDEGDFKQNLADHQAEVKEIGDDRIRARYDAEPEELPHAVMTSVYGRLGREIILQHPLAYAELMTRGMLVIALDDDADAITMVSRFPEETIVRLLIALYTTALALLAAAGIARLWRVDRRSAILLTLTIAYFLVISAGGESEGRFRVPLVPLEATCAGVGAIAVAAGIRGEAGKAQEIRRERKRE